jgi:hypothetical protein
MFLCFWTVSATYSLHYSTIAYNHEVLNTTYREKLPVEVSFSKWRGFILIRDRFEPPPPRALNKCNFYFDTVRHIYIYSTGHFLVTFCI